MQTPTRNKNHVGIRLLLAILEATDLQNSGGNDFQPGKRMLSQITSDKLLKTLLDMQILSLLAICFFS